MPNLTELEYQLIRRRIANEARFHQTELKDRFGRPYCGCAAFIKHEADTCEHLMLLQEQATNPTPLLG